MLMPGSDSTAQIGSTPNSAWQVSMKVTITRVGGLALPARKPGGGLEDLVSPFQLRGPLLQRPRLLAISRSGRCGRGTGARVSLQVLDQFRNVAGLRSSSQPACRLALSLDSVPSASRPR